MNKNVRIRKSNELINIRKRKILIKRSVFLVILLFVVLFTLCLKLPQFNITGIEVLNNRNVSENEVLSLSGILKGNNIFYINPREIKTNILSNPYILNVDVKRKLPNIIILDVSEREALFYTLKGNKYAVLDGNAIVLEIRDNIEGMKLVKVEGLKAELAEPGSTVQMEDERKLKTLKVFADLLKRNTSGLNFTSIDMNDLLNINVFISNMCLKLGSDENIELKLNKALNIVRSSDAENEKGYVDVSFEGNPVLYIEK